MIGRSLGKHAPRNDPRTLRLTKYLDESRLPASPPARDWSLAMSRPWGAMRNDEIGCCTAAAMGHLLQTWTAAQRALFTPSDTEILKAYAGYSGWSATDPSSDKGANMLDALNYWRNTGISSRKITAYVKLDPTNIGHVMTALNLFGGLYAGASLPLAAQHQRVWVAPIGETTPDDAPGSWGGHAMTVVGYDRSKVSFVTWGGIQTASWQWFTRYVDELYAVLGPEWSSAGRLSPSGFVFDELAADVKRIA